VSRAFQVLSSNKPVGAEEALEMGLVNRVVPAEGFIGAAMEFATVIAQGPPIALELTRKAVFRGLDTDLLSALELESLAQAVCLSTEDHQEGLNAFREKRAPRFAGR
jgi:enoyl-CoA hydratase/carnithine racemase